MKLTKFAVIISAISFAITPSVFAKEHGTITGIPDTTKISNEVHTETKDLKKNIEDTVRTNTKDLREKNATDRAAMKEKHKEDQEKRKQARLDQATKRLNEMNKRKTGEMTAALKRLSDALTKISKRTAEIKAKGVDTTTVDAAIAAAQSAITTAQSAVNAQAAKTYSVTDSTGTAAKQLWQDLQTVQKTVADARQKVGAITKEIGKLKKPTITPTPTI